MAGANSILFVDAYDSFSHNIIALLEQQLNTAVSLIHIDTDVEREYGLELGSYLSRYSAIVIGPGPGNPNKLDDVGLLYELINIATTQQIPILGICLGFQVLCVKHGLPITRMKQPCHGQAKKIMYYEKDQDVGENKDIFANVNLDDIWATCYNSLGLTLQNALLDQASSRPDSPSSDSGISATSLGSHFPPSGPIRVLAIDHEANVMAIRHRALPFWGLQFHPESCKSNEICQQLVCNWWYAAQHFGDGSAYSDRDVQASIDGICAQKLCTSRFDTRSLEDVGLPAQLHDNVEAIVALFLKVSSTTGSRVRWQKACGTYSQLQISNLIHDLSRQHDIAMLESTRKDRFSIYAILAEGRVRPDHLEGSATSCSWRIEYQDSILCLHPSGNGTPVRTRATRDEVWTALQSFVVCKRANEGPMEVPFWGGFIGYLSYEHGLTTLEVKSLGPKAALCPEISLMWVERSIIHDNLTDTLYVQSIRDDDDDFINSTSAMLSVPNRSWSRSSKFTLDQQRELQHILNTAEISLPNHDRYHAQFDQCQTELRAGNSYELCLTTETTVALTKAEAKFDYEFELYKNLHSHNPVPFGAFLRFGSITILGTSPEQYMSWSRDGVVDMIPMKGTVKRTPDMTFEKASEILASAKESAENLMIADLIRHDLYGALGQQSKVEVVRLCEVIEHETVYQLVSQVRGHAPLVDRRDADKVQREAIRYGLNALRETVPPGSMTGAPKKRSCEILAQLEQRDRGLYSGVLGYIDVGGSGNWNVCIRTAFRHHSESVAVGEKVRDLWHLGAGGAITVLSEAEGEWQEMMVKLETVLRGFQSVHFNGIV